MTRKKGIANRGYISSTNYVKVQIFDSYASRIGKGTYATLEKAEYFNKRYKWFLKLDYRQYFDSLDQAIIKKKLKRIFKNI